MACPASDRCVPAPLPAKTCVSFLQQLNTRWSSQTDNSCRDVAGEKVHSTTDPSNKLPVVLGSPRNRPVIFASLDGSPFSTPTKAVSFERCVTGLSSDRSTSVDYSDLENSHSGGSWKVRVKNTFVDLTDDSEDELPVARSKSEATHSSKQPSALQTMNCAELLASMRESRSKLQSVGSSLHASGSCKPCAWFYKLEGCANGAECRHCHLCPFEEKRRRRKASALARRRKGSSESLDDSPVAAPTARGFERSDSGFSTAPSTSASSSDLDISQPVTTWKIEVKNTFIHLADSSDDESPFGRCKTEPTHSALKSSALAILSSSDSGTTVPEPPSHSPSIGSELHSSGSCKPCAWFWKPAGCANGIECRHCHLCSEDEIKRRRKSSNLTRRRKGTRQIE